MRKSLLAVATVAVTLACVTSAYTYYRLAGTGQKMTSAAGALVDSLDEDQRKTMLYPYEAEQRLGWHFIPKSERKGLMMRNMSQEQQKQTHELLQVALSQAGYTKTDQIMENESLLKFVQKSGPIRDSLRYYVTIFGEPKEGQRWGLSFEGHHLSLNFVVEGDEVVSSTPQFFATNPAELKRKLSGRVPQGDGNLESGRRVGL